MAFTKRTLILCILLLSLPLLGLYAQDEEEYKMELEEVWVVVFTWVMPTTLLHLRT